MENHFIFKLTAYQKSQMGNVCKFKRNIQAPSRNHCRLGKAVSITYPEKAFVALGIHNAMSMRQTVICSQSDSTIISHIISRKARFKKKPRNLCFTFLYNLVWNISRSKQIWVRHKKMYICRHVKYPLFLSIFNRAWNFFDTFWKNIQVSKFMKFRREGA